MATPLAGELVWYRESGRIEMCVDAPPKVRKVLQNSDANVRVANLKLPWFLHRRDRSVVYRYPIRLNIEGNQVVAGPVYAILAGSGTESFLGSRLNFRDLIQVAKEQGKFVYVVPPENVSVHGAWRGYVRLGYQRWMELPCPSPEAMYNRIPNRYLENQPMVALAKRRLDDAGIPLFNSDYFNKAVIYDVIRAADLGRYLPETSNSFTAPQLISMLRRNRAVYLKPTGGSIGHGMILIRHQPAQYAVTVLKNSTGKTFAVQSPQDVWRLIRQQRVPGRYVIQAAKSLLEWNGRPCDFRVLLQKYRGRWKLIGKGVRVAGPNSITTHVPNGGSIANADAVLQSAFGDRAGEMSRELQKMTVQCAQAIDNHYGGALGEMSMDIGLDSSERLWFFEANSKPMKFDEPDIRRKSLLGVLARLDELRP
ncbi:MAG: hypothetical protein A2201_03655 [Alicyclobacillus sp. RIFOXYA1_FULL_53_8]|nr:MAG: hypothetical protein A2201_03655 [Alicyclobacillus sp. RIFOXYA1_FULL_53_8]